MPTYGVTIGLCGHNCFEGVTHANIAINNRIIIGPVFSVEGVRLVAQRCVEILLISETQATILCAKAVQINLPQESSAHDNIEPKMRCTSPTLAVSTAHLGTPVGFIITLHGIHGPYKKQTEAIEAVQALNAQGEISGRDALSLHLAINQSPMDSEGARHVIVLLRVSKTQPGPDAAAPRN